MFDQAPITVIKAEVPAAIMKGATKFTADGMDAISIPANQLSVIKNVTPLNHIPIGKYQIND